MGAIPAGGAWVQLEMPARGMNLANRSVSAFELWTHSGRVWFDRVGKKTCVAPAAAQPALSQTEVVWFDDAPPAGAVLRGPWTWEAQQHASGTLANVVPPGGESLEYWFDGATTPLNVGTNDVLTVYALIDPCDPPRAIMIGWYDGSWEHRAYWGEDLYAYGTAGPSRYSMGPLPAPAQWVRLEVPASAVGLAGSGIRGMSFYTFAGKAWFDRIGLQPPSGAAIAPQRVPTTLRARWGKRLRALASVLTRGRIGRTASYSAYQFTPSAGPAPTRIATATTPPLRRYSLYTPELNLLAETAMTTATSPPIAHEYIWFGGQPVAQLTTTTGEIAWYFNDHLGTPILQTDAASNVIWRVEREPYGTPHSYRAGIARHQPLAFPGQEERASESEVAYNVFRWYRAGWGRYRQSDPAWSPWRIDDLNAFSYAGASPVVLYDPTGLMSIDKGKCQCLQQQYQKDSLLESDLSILGTAITMSCLHIEKVITDPGLAKCMKKKCQTGKVTCDQKCKDVGMYTYKASNTLYVCVNNWPDWQASSLEKGVTHELAHMCGWDHDQGKGVPGNAGAVD
jgi:RHS repeat-associated protein